MKAKSGIKCILGYTDTETVMLDLDNASLDGVRYWAFRAMRQFRLQGFVILKSSENRYHVVFDRKVSWSGNMRIVAWVSLHSRNPMLEKWFIMQCIKEESTLRVSPKMHKPSPKVVFRHGKQDGQVREFLSFRRLIKKIIWKLRTRSRKRESARTARRRGRGRSTKGWG